MKYTNKITKIYIFLLNLLKSVIMQHLRHINMTYSKGEKGWSTNLGWGNKKGSLVIVVHKTTFSMCGLPESRCVTSGVRTRSTRRNRG